MMPKTIVKTWNRSDLWRGFYESKIFEQGYSITSESDYTETNVSGCNTCFWWIFLIPVFMISLPIGLLLALLVMMSGGKTHKQKVKVVYRLLS